MSTIEFNPAESGAVVIDLANLSRPQESPALGDDRPREILGQPVKYAWKAMLKVGDVHHKGKDGKPKVLHVPPEFMANLARDTNKWLRNGGKIRLPKTHASANPDANCGWIKDPLKVENGELWGLHQLIGEDAHKAASRNDTSVSINYNFKDSSTGEIYPAIIEHNAIVSDPVHNGLGDFVQLSASAGGAEEYAPVFTASTPSKEISMNAELRKRLLAQTGAAETVTDDDLLSRAADELDKQKGDIETLSRSAKSAKDTLATVESERDELRNEAADVRTELDTAKVQLSRNAKAKPTSGEIFFAQRCAASERAEVIRSRFITPAVADRAEQIFLKKKIAPETITLSREVEDDDYKLVDGYADLLDFYSAVKGNALAPKTGEAQRTTELSRETPGNDPSKEPDADTLKKWDDQDKALRERQLQSAGAK